MNKKLILGIYMEKINQQAKELSKVLQKRDFLKK